MPKLKISVLVPPSGPANSLLTPEPTRRFLVLIDPQKTVGDLFHVINNKFVEQYCQGLTHLASSFFIIKLQDASHNDLGVTDVIGDIFDDLSHVHDIVVVRGSLSRGSSIPVATTLRPADYTIPSSSRAAIFSSDPAHGARPGLDSVAEEDYARLNPDRPLESSESERPASPDLRQDDPPSPPYSRASVVQSQAAGANHPPPRDVSPDIQDYRVPCSAAFNDGFRVPSLPKRKRASDLEPPPANGSSASSKRRRNTPFRPRPSAPRATPVDAPQKHATDNIGQHSRSPNARPPDRVNSDANGAVQAFLDNLPSSPALPDASSSTHGQESGRDTVQRAATKERAFKSVRAFQKSRGEEGNLGETGPDLRKQRRNPFVDRDAWTHDADDPIESADDQLSIGARERKEADRFVGYVYSPQSAARRQKKQDDFAAAATTNDTGSGQMMDRADASSGHVGPVRDSGDVVTPMLRSRRVAEPKRPLIQSTQPDRASSDSRSAVTSPRSARGGKKPRIACVRCSHTKQKCVRDDGSDGGSKCIRCRKLEVECVPQQQGSDRGGFEATPTPGVNKGKERLSDPFTLSAARAKLRRASRPDGPAQLDGRSSSRASVESDRAPARFSPGEQRSRMVDDYAASSAGDSDEHGSDSEDLDKVIAVADEEEEGPSSTDEEDSGMDTESEPEEVETDPEKEDSDPDGLDMSRGGIPKAWSRRAESHAPRQEGSFPQRTSSLGGSPLVMKSRIQAALSPKVASQGGATTAATQRTASSLGRSAPAKREVTVSSTSSSSDFDEDELEQHTSDEEDEFVQQQIRDFRKARGPPAKPGTKEDRQYKSAVGQMLTSTWNYFSSSQEVERPWHEVPAGQAQAESREAGSGDPREAGDAMAVFERD